MIDSAIQIKLRPFSRTHVHLLPIPLPGLKHDGLVTVESTTNLGPNYTLDGKRRIPEHYTRPINPLRIEEGVAVATFQTRNLDVVGGVEIGHS